LLKAKFQSNCVGWGLRCRRCDRLLRDPEQSARMQCVDRRSGPNSRARSSRTPMSCRPLMLPSPRPGSTIGRLSPTRLASRSLAPSPKGALSHQAAADQQRTCLRADRQDRRMHSSGNAARTGNFCLSLDRADIDPCKRRFEVNLRLEGTVRGTGLYAAGRCGDTRIDPWWLHGRRKA
jgi:hypothetical protein